MFVEESVLKALIKASKSLYYDRRSKSLIFLSRDRDQIYLIQKDPESEKTFEYMHDLEALDVGHDVLLREGARHERQAQVPCEELVGDLSDFPTLRTRESKLSRSEPKSTGDSSQGCAPIPNGVWWNGDKPLVIDLWR